MFPQFTPHPFSGLPPFISHQQPFYPILTHLQPVNSLSQGLIEAYQQLLAVNNQLNAYLIDTNLKIVKLEADLGVEKKVNAAWSRSSAEADEGKNAEILQLQDRETALTAELKLANERILKLEEEASREKTAKEEIDGRQRRKRGQTPMEADRTRTLDKLVESLRADIAKRDEELKTMKSSLANLKLENAAIKRVYEAKIREEAPQMSEIVAERASLLKARRGRKSTVVREFEECVEKAMEEEDNLMGVSPRNDEAEE